jgi:transposase
MSKRARFCSARWSAMVRWHQKGVTRGRNNIVQLPLAPYSLELSPVEKPLEYLRDNKLSTRFQPLGHRRCHRLPTPDSLTGPPLAAISSRDSLPP